MTGTITVQKKSAIDTNSEETKVQNSMTVTNGLLAAIVGILLLWSLTYVIVKCFCRNKE